MKTKLVKRFYCDHCGKGRFHRSAMTRHERACIYNPARICPMCAEVKLEQAPIPQLLAAFDECPTNDLSPLRKLTNGCPACILSALVQGREKQHAADEESDWIAFDYKEARTQWYRDLQTDHSGNPMAPMTIEY